MDSRCREYGDNFLYDDEQFEDSVGSLMVSRTHTQTLQNMLMWVLQNQGCICIAKGCLLVCIQFESAIMLRFLLRAS